MENNVETQIKDFNKKYKISSELSKKFSFVSEENRIQNSSIAGRPKKMLVEITKRFFSNPVVIISLIVFSFIILSSLIIPARGIAAYQPNRLINDYSFIKSLPPIYKPIISKTVDNTDEVFKFWNNLKSNIAALPASQQAQWNEWFAFFLNSTKLEYISLPNGDINQILTYDAYHLFRAAILNQELVKAVNEGKDAAVEFSKINASIPVLKTYLGTTSAGYDIWITTWYATWRGIEIAIITTIIQAAFGITLGAILGFYAGRMIDTIIMRIIDIFNSPPTIIWILIFVALFGTKQVSLILAMSIAGWPVFVGITRMYVITVKNEEYIIAAKAIGASNARQIFVHALPAIIGKIANAFVKNVPAVILWVASLAFLGFFKDPSETNLGQILIENASEAGANIWIILLPTLILLLLSLSLNFMALGIHDALDPRVMSKGKRK
ncbi:ABC transporter permease [Mycoplasma enhydrae]|uniref:ABC transporter permease n=1 Tax=Mycoplasma enhydrae TaxID=2499220 RepID=UPI00197C1611|nr:ABC transporter permease [Mycoplasma enhydrae]MBN4089193.1 ABC transporter permease [Mycoplasma enhydrae]MCV3733857.1 ABC transporter permease [Mycoplasma enhydrae]MCV3753711.1 ABC transporter permease [Mycoplasma enhydrae]